MTSEMDVLEPQSDILSTDTSLSDAVPVDVAMPLPVCGDGIVDPVRNVMIAWQLELLRHLPRNCQ